MRSSLAPDWRRRSPRTHVRGRATERWRPASAGPALVRAAPLLRICVLCDTSSAVVPAARQCLDLPVAGDHLRRDSGSFPHWRGYHGSARCSNVRGGNCLRSAKTITCRPMFSTQRASLRDLFVISGGGLYLELVLIRLLASEI